MRAVVIAAVMLLGPPATADTIAIVGGRIVTNDAPGLIEKGAVVIKDGRIAAVGAGVTPPAGARVIDAQGKWVTPGVIAAFSRIGIVGVEQENAVNDGRVGATPVAAAADVAMAFDPDEAAIAVTRVEGVTRAAVAPIGGPSPISGYGAIADLSGGPQSILRRRAFVYVEGGDIGAARAGASRATLWPYLDAALSDAAAFPMRFLSHTEGSVLRRAEAEALAPVLKGDVAMMLRVERAADIRQALAFKARYPAIQLTLVGVSEGWRVADELARAGAPVIVDPVQNLPDSYEQVGARLDNAALLRKAGVTVAIAPAPGADDAAQLRLILQLAGNAVANGMSWADGFAAITSVPARILAMPDAGRLAPGMAGDIVIWDGDPLEVMSAPDMVFIAGQETSPQSRQTLLRDRYRDLNDADRRPFQYRR